MFIHASLVDAWVVSAFWLLWIAVLWTWAYKYLFESLLPVLLGIYLELLDHMVILYLIFKGMLSFLNFLPRANIGGTWSTERRIRGAWGGCGKFGLLLKQVFLTSNWWIKGSVAEWCLRNSLHSLTWYVFFLPAETGSLLTANPVWWVKDRITCAPYSSRRRELSGGDRTLSRPFLVSPSWAKMWQALSVEWVNIWTSWTSWAATVLISKTSSFFLSFSALLWLKSLQKPLEMLSEIDTPWPPNLYFQAASEPGDTF